MPESVQSSQPESLEAAAAEAATPMMRQYLEIKAAHPDCLLFYRMGDFYELFFEDAAEAAGVLDIALTKRGQHEGRDVPMAGVPVHSAESYLSRLIRAGFKVAVCEQTEDPAEAKKRGSKAVVRREVVRLVTPGTLTEDELLDARHNNYLAALARAEGRLALAWTDMSTGALQAMETTRESLAADLAQLAPGELLASETLVEELAVARALDVRGSALSARPAQGFDSRRGGRRLTAAFGVETLEGFGDFSRAELAGFDAVLGYIEETQKGRMPRLRPPQRLERGSVMRIDGATRRNLELTEALGGGRAGSLLATVDRTITGAGARLLARRIAAPLADPSPIAARLDAVALCLEESALRGDLRKLLRRAPDLERALTRLSLQRGSPRDLAMVRDALTVAGELRARLEREGERIALPEELATAASALAGHQELAGELGLALVAEPPVLAREGGFIAQGYHAALDECRTLRDESRRLIASLEARYREETGISGLKIRHNNVLGYHIDVSARAAEALMRPPLNETFIHRQTLANNVRFSTTELADLAARISQAGDRALALEQEIFARLAARITEAAPGLAAAAEALAVFDVSTALAELAASERWNRPVVHGGSGFVIERGRHPVVEAALKHDGPGRFVANDCDLSDGRRVWLVTGPNMAGKSTFLRQNALIAVLAQSGAFVPAERAEIGVVDRLFSRVGAADDLAHGRSTFMVEMVETASILNQAGPRALVILDEIGRGTATYDGLSIAWAALEHLHDVNGARTLFATHYHELTALKESLDELSLRFMRVKEWEGEVVFLHEVAPGAVDRSYGIQVARLAGLPARVIERARQVLTELESAKAGERARTVLADLPLFQTAAEGDDSSPEASEPRGPSPLEAALAEVHPDELSPREALDLLYRLKALAETDPTAAMPSVRGGGDPC